jgi:hypothetical protein
MAAVVDNEMFLQHAARAKEEGYHADDSSPGKLIDSRHDGADDEVAPFSLPGTLEESQELV